MDEINVKSKSWMRKDNLSLVDKEAKDFTNVISKESLNDIDEDISIELKDPVKLLVEMVKKGEINPWNIDVIDVADKFLYKLEKAKKLDLRISGRVLLYAAILVRMKAEVLAEEAIFEELQIENKTEIEEEIIPDELNFDVFEFSEENFGDIDDYKEYNKITEEDEVMAYLLSPCRKVRRFTTLKDLIKELKKAEKTETNTKTKRKKDKKISGKEILKVPHEEDIEDTVLRIEKKLEKILSNKKSASFFNIVNGLDTSEILSYYISILYLSFRGKIAIEQEKLFESDIIIRCAENV